MPGPEDAVALSEHGSMSDGYVAKYLTSPEGAVRKDWLEIFKGGPRAAAEGEHSDCACCPRCQSPAPWSCGHYDRDGNEIPEEA